MEAPDHLRRFVRWDRTLFYYDSLDISPAGASAVLLVHGLGDEADTWQQVFLPLAERYRVIAPDLPGSGRSPLPPRRERGPEAVARRLGELLSACAIGRATLVGNSLGAIVVQLLARSAPKRAGRLVLVDGSLLVETRLSPRFLAALFPTLVRRRFRAYRAAPQAAYDSLRPYYGELDRLPEEQRAFLRRRVSERVESDGRANAYSATFRALVGWRISGGSRAAAEVRRLHVPTRYLWGSRDRIITPEVGAAAAGRESAATFTLIEGAGHLPHQERAADFLRLFEGD